MGIHLRGVPPAPRSAAVRASAPGGRSWSWGRPARSGASMSPSPRLSPGAARLWAGRLVTALPVAVTRLARGVSWYRPGAAGSVPGRTAAGIYFSLILLPALQVAGGAFWGRRGALAAGTALAGLTLAGMALPARPMAVQPVQWVAGFATPQQALRAVLAPPPGSRATRLLAAGGSATLYICLERGSTDDLEILLDGHPLPVVARPPPPPSGLPRGVAPPRVPPPGPRLDTRRAVTGRPHPQRWSAADSGATTLIGGYTRPRASGGLSGRGRFPRRRDLAQRRPLAP